jgi:hypothetical protein
MNHPPALPAGQPLSRRTKFIYGLGDWGTSAATVARNTFWFVFLTNVVGLGAGLAGTVVLVACGRAPQVQTMQIMHSNADSTGCIYCKI